jgi:hypothetical protein
MKTELPTFKNGKAESLGTQEVSTFPSACLKLVECDPTTLFGSFLLVSGCKQVYYTRFNIRAKLLIYIMYTSYKGFVHILRQA